MQYGANIWAVLLSVVVSCILGSLWFGPFFGKQWMQLMGFTEDKKSEMKKGGMVRSYGIMIVSAIVMTYVFAYLLRSFAIADSSSAMQFAAILWLGFIATVMTGQVSWENKPWKLWVITAGYELVNLVIVSMILVRFS